MTVDCIERAQPPNPQIDNSDVRPTWHIQGLEVIWKKILSFVSLQDLARCQLVCRPLANVVIPWVWVNMARKIGVPPPRDPRVAKVIVVRFYLKIKKLLQRRLVYSESFTITPRTIRAIPSIVEDLLFEKQNLKGILLDRPTQKVPNRILEILESPNRLTAEERKKITAFIALRDQYIFLSQVFKQLRDTEHDVPRITADFSSIASIESAIRQMLRYQNEHNCFRHIERLNLLRQGIFSLPPVVGELHNLSELYVMLNFLRTLPPQMGKLRKLQILDLENNFIFCLPQEMRKLEQLFILELDSNLLIHFPLQICSITNLSALLLMSNLFTSLPPDIGLVRRLHLLHLASNLLTSLPQEFGNLCKLRELLLADNFFKALPSAVRKLSLQLHWPIHEFLSSWFLYSQNGIR